MFPNFDKSLLQCQNHRNTQSNSCSNWCLISHLFTYSEQLTMHLWLTLVILRSSKVDLARSVPVNDTCKKFYRWCLAGSKTQHWLSWRQHSNMQVVLTAASQNVKHFWEILLKKNRLQRFTALCIPRKFSFAQINDEKSTRWFADFIDKRTSDGYSEACQRSKMELFMEIVNSYPAVLF